MQNGNSGEEHRPCVIVLPGNWHLLDRLHYLKLCIGLTVVTVLVQGAIAGEPCAACHPRETAGFEKTAMAHSLSAVSVPPAGGFRDAFSGTSFDTRVLSSGVWQILQRPGESETVRLQYVIGSGAHAFGYLARIGNELFQSPIAYYTGRRAWGMAPGYQGAKRPNFSRPATLTCLLCHADRPRAITNTLNSYLYPAFAQPLGHLGIQCDRCHGDVSQHLKNPVPGSIINPARLPPAARDSVCEQCHLAGEVRVPNPGREISDFYPGEPLENVYSVYVVRGPPQASIKVISQSEELAMSMCARKSGSRLWCGTCHNPHETSADPAAYFRMRCLSCHAATLAPAHASRKNCIGCHMPTRPASNGTHTAFTDHRILARPEVASNSASAPAKLVAWRPAPAAFRDRNFAIALVTAGLENSAPQEAIRGYRMLNAMQDKIANDAPALTALGTVLLKAKQPEAAQVHFARALALRPGYAPYEVNLAAALAESGHADEAIQQLEKAVQIDPLLQRAVELLSGLYAQQGESEKAAAVVSRYRAAMGMTAK